MRQLIGGSSGYQICQADDTLMSSPRIDETGGSTALTSMTTLATFDVPEDYHATQQSTLMLVCSFKTSSGAYPARLRVVNGMAYPNDTGCVTWQTGGETAAIVVPCVGGDTITIQGCSRTGGTMTLSFYNVYALDVHAKTDESPGGISWE